MRLGCLALILTALAGTTCAQNATTTIVSTVPVSTVSRTVSRSGSASISLSTVFSVQTTVTSFPTATASSVPDSSENALNTRIGPAFGVLGGLLILTGLPSAFWGHKNRWSSFFITGFYTLSIVCMSLIIRFGVLEAVEPPSETVQGLFVLSCGVAGIIGGGIAIFFWKGTKYFIGAWGGYAVGLFIQCLHDDGLIEPLGFRYFLYIGCTVIGFVLCTLPRLHYQVLLASTAVVGASAFILGVDCYTRAGLKEFYVYNLGFKALFPQFDNTPFRVTQTMQIELGMMGAVAIMGMAVQARVLMALQARLKEINAEQERRNAEIEAKAAVQFSQRDEELAQWEREHGSGSRNRHSSRPDDLEASRTITPETHRASSQFSIFKGSKEKGRSSLTMADQSTPPQSTPKEERNIKPELTLDLGESVGETLLAPGGVRSTVPSTGAENADPSLKKSVELLSEIRGIRAAINAIKQETTTSLYCPSTLDTVKLDGSLTGSSTRPRGGSLGTPLGAVNTVGTGPRNNTGQSTQRGSSTPMSNEWDNYVKSRSLFQPPSGVSQPVAPTRVEPRPYSISVPQAVSQAVEQRQRQERAYLEGGPEAYLEVGSSGSRPGSALFGSFNGPTKSGDSLPLADRRRTHSDSKSLAQYQTRPASQVYILPPKPSPVQTPDRPVVKTFEELSTRHKEKIKALQEPLSKRTTEEAQVAAARSRWERSVATEKNVMSRKEQEASRRDQPRRGEDPRHSHTRSSSAFALQSSAETSRRPTSTAKVQGWQRHQDATQQHRSSQADGRAPGRSRSKSPLPLSGGRQP